MNKFNPYHLGGWKVKSDEIMYLQDAVNQPLIKTFLSLNSGVFILSGCVRSVAGGTTSVTAGFIVYEGEVCEVPAHSFSNAVAGETEIWQKSIVYSGTKTFLNGSTHDLYEAHICQLVKVTTLPGTYYTYSSKTLKNVITESLQLNSWQIVNTQIVGAGGAVPGTYVISRYTDLDGFVHLRGKYHFEDAGSGAVNILIGTLPVGSRPVSDIPFFLNEIINTSTGAIGNAFGYIYAADGQIRIKSLNIGYSAILDFGQITPFRTS